MRILNKNLKLKAQVVLFLGTVAVTLAIYFLTTPGVSSDRYPARFSKGESHLSNLKDFKRKVIRTLKIDNLSNEASVVSLALPAEICEHFQKFSLILEAEGAAVNGEPLRLTKTKACTDLDPETLRIRWEVGRPDQPALLDKIIQTWNIKSMTFEGAKDEAPIRISSFEIIYVLGAPASVQLN